jgi:hypothetical protein
MLKRKIQPAGKEKVFVIANSGEQNNQGFLSPAVQAFIGMSVTPFFLQLKAYSFGN